MAADPNLQHRNLQPENVARHERASTQTYQEHMPLTLEELEDIQADCMADDVEIDFEKMSSWDETTVRVYFENGGQLPAMDPPASETGPDSAVDTPILTMTEQQPLQGGLLPLAEHGGRWPVSVHACAVFLGAESRDGDKFNQTPCTTLRLYTAL